MKKIFNLLIVLLLLSICCSENCVDPEEPTPDDGISWDQITGRLAYLKGNILYLLDADSGSVKTLGATNLTNLKWNKTAGKITGISFINDSTYSLESIDLNGNHDIINNKLSTSYYDWLPDGRLVTFSTEGNLLIDGVVLLNQKFDPVFGMACSPDGNKIVVSTDNILENYLLEIDINTLSDRIIERNSNLLEPNYLQPIYSLESDKVLYLKIIYELQGDGWYYYLMTFPNIKLGRGKDPCRSNNLRKILYTNILKRGSTNIGIYSMDIEDGNSVELIRSATSPIWIY